MLEVGENTNEADFMIVKHLHGIRAILHAAFDTEDALTRSVAESSTAELLEGKSESDRVSIHAFLNAVAADHRQEMQESI